AQTTQAQEAPRLAAAGMQLSSDIANMSEAAADRRQAIQIAAENDRAMLNAITGLTQAQMQSQTTLAGKNLDLQAQQALAALRAQLGGSGDGRVDPNAYVPPYVLAARSSQELKPPKTEADYLNAA